MLSADSASGAIKSHLYESGAFSSDAIEFRALSLDTARYQLTPDTRAFGVRIGYSGASRVNPYSATALNLYVDDGQKTRKVLDNLLVSESTGEWDGTCEGDFSQTNRNLAIGKAVSKGYAALEIAGKTVTSHSTPKGDDCNTRDDKPELKKSVLNYNGSQYDVPKELSYQ